MIRKYLLLATLLLLPAISRAQVVAAGRGGNQQLFAGGYFSDFSPDYGYQRLYGVGGFVDYNLTPRLGAEAEARFLRFHQLANIHEDNYLIGPKINYRTPQIYFLRQRASGLRRVQLPAECGPWRLLRRGARRRRGLPVVSSLLCAGRLRISDLASFRGTAGCAQHSKPSQWTFAQRLQRRVHPTASSRFATHVKKKAELFQEEMRRKSSGIPELFLRYSVIRLRGSQRLEVVGNADGWIVDVVPAVGAEVG